MFGAMPSQGFFIRHVKNIEMRNIEIRAMQEDFRPAFILNDVKGADFNHVRSTQAANVPAFVLKDVDDFDLRSSPPAPDIRIQHTGQQTV
jgi:hypothetical protein